MGLGRVVPIQLDLWRSMDITEMISHVYVTDPQ